MKHITIFTISLILLGVAISCNKEDEIKASPKHEECDESLECEASLITDESNKANDSALRTEIYSQILELSNSKTCTDGSEWKQLPIGQKGCGGHSGFIAYHKDIDTTYFINKVNCYQELGNRYYNKYPEDLGISTCDIPIPGEITCKDGEPIYPHKQPTFNLVTNPVCDYQVIINKDEYEKAQPANLTINSAEINNGCLKVNFGSSGCSGNTWQLKLIDSGDILESNPIQRNLTFVLHNEELCQAYITKELTFDISNLQVEGGKVILNIQGMDEGILYEY